MPEGFGGDYGDDQSGYEAALAEWKRKVAAGDPFPGPMPRQGVSGQIKSKLEQLGYPSEIANQQMWVDRTRAGAQAGPTANPYSRVVADQSRPAQMALLAQMRAQQAGPSIAAMQGARAQGQNLQAALAAGGGRGTMMQAGRVGGGLAGDTAMGRLAEQLRASQGLGGLSSGIRGGDLGVAGTQAQFGLQQRSLDDAMRQFYAAQGAGLNQSINRNELEQLKLIERLRLQAKQNDMKKADAGANAVAPIAAGGV